MGILDAPFQALTGIDFRRFSEGIYNLPMVGSSYMPRTLSSGANQAASCQTKMLTRVPVRSIRFMFANFQGIESSTGNAAITVKASMLTSLGAGGVLIPLTFATQATVSIPIDKFAVSDPIAIDLPTPGTAVFIVTYVSVGTLGQKWPMAKYGYATDSEGTHNDVDDTASTTGITTGLGNGYVYGPSAMLGQPAGTYNRPRIACVGDSIMRGAQGQTPFSETYGLHVISPLKDYIAHNVAAYGENASQWAPSAGHYKRAPFLDGCTTAICEYGINDCKTPSMTLATLQANNLRIWTELANRGMRVIQTTITPYTTSTDSFATVANQTLGASPYDNNIRTGYNDWLRDGAPIDATTKAAVAVGTSSNVLRAGAVGHPLYTYFEVADTVESSRNSGKWKVDGTPNKYTLDGIHPTNNGYVLMAAALDTTKFI